MTHWDGAARTYLWLDHHCGLRQLPRLVRRSHPHQGAYSTPATPYKNITHPTCPDHGSEPLACFCSKPSRLPFNNPSARYVVA